MRSPFPGMDPYLEAHWRNVHQRLCVHACDALQPQLQPAMLQPGTHQTERRPALHAKIQTRSVSGFEPSNVPDDPATGGEPLQTSDDCAVAKPLIIKDVFESFIEIIEPENGRRLVTVVEFFTPSIKYAGYDQEAYLRKRREYRSARVNLVEIDLLRDGRRILMAHHRIPASHLTTYQVCVRRSCKWQTEVYAVPLRHPLPTIRIPLREGAADAHLDLQALIGQTYADGAYDSLDYRKPPDPPLDEADAQWAGELLRAPRA